jgi:hypothetical protein
MVPVAGQYAVLDAAAVERKAHVRAAVVEREDAIPIRHHQDRPMRSAHDQPPVAFELIERACAQEFGAHACTSMCCDRMGRGVTWPRYPSIL